MITKKQVQEIVDSYPGWELQRGSILVIHLKVRDVEATITPATGINEGNEGYSFIIVRSKRTIAFGTLIYTPRTQLGVFKTTLRTADMLVNVHLLAE